MGERNKMLLIGASQLTDKEGDLVGSVRCSRGATIRSDKFAAIRRVIRMESGATVCSEK